MLQNTGPPAIPRSPSTSVCREDGVRQGTTVRGGPNRLPSSKRRTSGKSARTADVRLEQPSAAKVSSRPTIWGRPATSTSGLGTTIPPAARRDPSPPARISPCTSGEHPFDVRKTLNSRGGSGPVGCHPLGRREPARLHAEI